MTRGDVHELKPPRRARGHEQRADRFGVVVQAPELDLLSTVIVVPTSLRAIASELQPVAQVRDRRVRVLVAQLRVVDRSRLGKRVGRLTREEMLGIDDALRTVFGLL